MLILQNDDQPGVVGRVGTFLGDHKINIAQMYLSRNRAGGVALAVYQVDSVVDAGTIAELCDVQHVLSVQQINL
jgi:D-3-phosphoglycerate dehydrogenase